MDGEYNLGRKWGIFVQIPHGLISFTFVDAKWIIFCQISLKPLTKLYGCVLKN